MNNWFRFEQQSDLDQALAEHIASLLERDIGARGQASLAVSGGRTPTGMFEALSRCPLPWQQVAITLVDERWVPADSQEANELLLREHLLRNEAASARFIPLKSEHGDARDAASEINARIAQMPSPFSALVLGMGNDGHTASWFPEASELPSLLDPQATVEVAATDPVTAPHQRMTLTLARVLASREIMIHITGEEKAMLITAASEGGYPISAVLEQMTTPTSIWWAPL